MAKKANVKERVIPEVQAKDYKRMDVAAAKYGVTVSYLKKLINEGRLTRYKVGVITFIDTHEFERMIVKDNGNHGIERAPEVTRQACTRRGSR